MLGFKSSHFLFQLSNAAIQNKLIIGNKNIFIANKKFKHFLISFNLINLLNINFMLDCSNFTSFQIIKEYLFGEVNVRYKSSMDEKA